MGWKKKEAQAARRLAKDKLKEYGTEWKTEIEKYKIQLTQKLAVFNNALKPRPRWLPKRVWHWFGSLFINLDDIERLLQTKK